MRWFDTMNRLLQLGVTLFAECGPSENLCNMARNLEGDFRIYHPREFGRLFASVG
jgi:malonyl CoA-acyl carrier protein transacylase